MNAAVQAVLFSEEGQYKRNVDCSGRVQSALVQGGALWHCFTAEAASEVRLKIAGKHLGFRGDQTVG